MVIIQYGENVASGAAEAEAEAKLGSANAAVLLHNADCPLDFSRDRLTVAE